MKRFFLPLLAIVILGTLGAGCKRPAAKAPPMTAGASREQVVAHLARQRAHLLEDSPERIRAEYQPADRPSPTRVEFTFSDGKLTRMSGLPANH